MNTYFRKHLVKLIALVTVGVFVLNLSLLFFFAEAIGQDRGRAAYFSNRKCIGS